MAAIRTRAGLLERLTVVLVAPLAVAAVAVVAALMVVLALFLVVAEAALTLLAIPCPEVTGRVGRSRSRTHET